MNDATEKLLLKQIEQKIVLYPDFPKPGVLFRDVMPILNEPTLCNAMIEIFAHRVRDCLADRVLGIESRGFLFGPLLAQKLNVPFNPIRKRGKLPGETMRVDYSLEYGIDSLEIQKGVIPKYNRVIIFDDLLATGGSMDAAKKLVEISGARVVACLTIIELEQFGSYRRLGDTRLEKLFSY